MKSHRLALVFTILLLSVPATAAERERGAAALDQALRDLASDLRVACLAAHPDDEDGETLALLRRKHGVRTTVICFTSGEGGQNEIGGDLYADLARIRIRETRAAAAVIGADLELLGLPDFGYSRSAVETFGVWEQEETVRRLVAAIRRIRPHVVITNHDTETGHGHHQAVGIAALEAFDAAADPDRFPDEGEPWRIRKLYVRCPEEEADAKPDVSGIDPVRGLSYAEMGVLSLKQHRSQGTWDQVKIEPGPRIHPYRLVKSRLEDGGDRLLAGLPVPRPEWLGEKNRAGTRREILARLVALKAGLDDDRSVDRAIAAALGVEVRLSTVPATVIEGTPYERHAEVRSVLPVRVVSESWTTRPGREIYEGSLAAEGVAGEFGVREEMEVESLPAVQVRILPWGRLLRPVVGGSVLRVLVRNRGPRPFRAKPELGFDGTDRIDATLPEEIVVPADGEIGLAIPLVPREDVEPGLFGIRLTLGTLESTDVVRVLEVEAPRELLIGVVQTYGDEPYRALRALGLRASLLTDEDLLAADLSRFDTIYLGIRPYRARPVLTRVNPRLLRFVEEGGYLVVNYSKSWEWSPDYAPFPLEIGRDRVTREDAEMVFPDTDHRLLDFPNEIPQEDFDGWVQERGLYFPKSFDADAYEVVLKCADPGRPLLPGLLVAKYGKGRYVYTCLGWYRQIRALNPAAWKMLANLVSYPWEE